MRRAETWLANIRQLVRGSSRFVAVARVIEKTLQRQGAGVEAHAGSRA